MMRDIREVLIEHKVATVLIAAFTINVLACLLPANFDSAYWATVVRNIRSGFGLYAVDGYFYTPVWGYMLGATDAIASIMINVGNYLTVVPQAIGIRFDPFCFTSESTAPIFNIVNRSILIAGNFILAYLVHTTVIELGYSNDAAFKAMALTLFCPILIVGSCIIGMPDVYSAVFILGTILMMLRKQFFFAGVFFAISVLTKFFPVFLIFIVLAYIMAVYRDDIRTCAKQIALSVSGALVTTIVIYIPIIMEGMFWESFRFISDRSTSVEGFITSHLFMMVGAIVAAVAIIGLLIHARRKNGVHYFNCRNLVLLGVLFAVAILGLTCAMKGIDGVLSSSRVAFYVFSVIMGFVMGIALYRNRDGDFNKRFIMMCFLMMTVCMLYPPTPQYLVIIVPFMVMVIGMGNRMCRKGYVLISIAVIVFVMICNGPLLLSLAEWTDLISVDTVMAVHNLFNVSIGGITLRHLLYLGVGIFQYIGILVLLWYGQVENNTEGFSDVVKEIDNDRAFFVK